MQKIKDLFHHLFIPREENNFRAKSLHTDFLTFYLLIALVMSFVFKKIDLTNVLGYATDITIDKLYELTNSERQKNNLGSLVLNDRLSVAAAQKANDMFAKNYWAHYSPTGTTPWDFISGNGYSYEFAGENLAKNFLFSQGVVDAWMNSPTHRDNILKKDYTEVGFAVVNGTLNGEPTTLVVQMFGTPIAVNNYIPPPKTVAAEELPVAIETPVPSISQMITATPVKSEPPSVMVAGAQPPDTGRKWFSTFNVDLVFFSFLLLALALDFYYAAKMRIIRVAGRNVVHFAFIAFIIAGLIISTRGKII